jgi:FemAB-related protein (PEP-CTERM system-associated)
MSAPLTYATSISTTVRLLERKGLPSALPRLEAYLLRDGPLMPLSRHPGWLNVLARGLRHTPYCLEAVDGGRTRGFLALAYVRSLLFGRFLVGLPYLNYGGPIADDTEAARCLIDGAVRLADELNVKYLELRQEYAFEHPSLKDRRTEKVHMRLDLPATPGKLWDELDGKVRNQVRKGQKSALSVDWGGHDRLEEFYTVFSQNMRDLGTPVYGKRLFAAILDEFPGRAELCIMRAGTVPVAAALLLHGWGVTEVPSASSLRSHNHLCPNMLMYWHLLERSIQRGQDVFDFGRSSRDSSTLRFKQQWGASPAASEWQFYLRRGELSAMQKESPKYQKFIRMWQRLPVALTRVLGPAIVRGIP